MTSARSRCSSLLMIGLPPPGVGNGFAPHHYDNTHCSRRPVGGGGFRRNIAITFGTEDLEWCGCPTVKTFDDMFSRFKTIPVCDRQPNGQTVILRQQSALCIASHGNKNVLPGGNENRFRTPLYRSAMHGGTPLGCVAQW